MEHEVVDARAAGRSRLWLRFRDGTTGEVDVAELVPFEGIFAPLAEAEFFARVGIHPETCMVVWPTGADLDADVLYSRVTGRSDALPVRLDSAR